MLDIFINIYINCQAVGCISVYDRSDEIVRIVMI